MVQDAGAAALAVHGRTAAQSYGGDSDWRLIARVASEVGIPVFGSGDCVEAGQILRHLQESGVAGVLVGRGALRNPWIFAQAAAMARGETLPYASLSSRGQFLLDYVDLLLRERVDEAAGFRHVAPGTEGIARPVPARGRDRWIINKVRALGSWYTKGLEGGSQLRTAVNSAESIEALRQIVQDFFMGRCVAQPGI
jgi:tRNA-dihydrouridine synthase